MHAALCQVSITWMDDRLGILGAVGPVFFTYSISISFFWSPFPLGPVQSQYGPEIAEIDLIGVERLVARN